MKKIILKISYFKNPRSKKNVRLSIVEDDRGLRYIVTEKYFETQSEAFSYKRFLRRMINETGDYTV